MTSSYKTEEVNNKEFTKDKTEYTSIKSKKSLEKLAFMQLDFTEMDIDQEDINDEEYPNHYKH
jgi:subtilase family serine protease